MGKGKEQEASSGSAKKATVSAAKASRGPVKRLFAALFRLWPLWLVLLFCGALAYVALLDYRVRLHFSGAQWSLPAHVYARPLELYVGASLSASELEEELRQLGYRPRRQADVAGSYRRVDNRFDITTRAFRYWDGEQVSRRLRIEFDVRHVTRLSALDKLGSLQWLRLEPQRIATIHPVQHEDRQLVRYAEVPALLIDGLLVVEDRDFFSHHGVRPAAIARALLANLRAGGTVQGGSTLTQQLVKNLFLSNERTLQRKAVEAVMALLLEWRYSKPQILEAYLNEVYLGQSGARAIHGFGLASEFYFKRPLNELEVQHLALLVGLVQGASYYNPYRHPERATKRRNLVLRLMFEAQLIDELSYLQAVKAPLGLGPQEYPGHGQHPAYLDLVKRQLLRDYHVEDLRAAGLRIFTYMEPHLQQRAERVVAAAIKKLPASGRYRNRQSALISADRSNGEVLALVGGREVHSGSFNRVLDAQRPIGSLIKPVVYLTALAQPERYQLSSLVQDRAVSLKTPTGDVWQPQNYDHEEHGEVMLYQGLVHSYNLSSVRLGLGVGLPAVVAQLGKLGLERSVNPYPSLLLGALELSPLEVATLYQTLANGGFNAPLRTIHAVLTAGGEPLQRYPLEVSAGADPAAVYLTNYALQKVASEGTARSLNWRLPDLNVAGKTGTTDDLRDSWFAGFTDRLMTVVWVGNDDNSPMGLTGSSGALPIWSDFMGAAEAKPLTLVAPSGIEWAWVEPGGFRSRQECPGAVYLPFSRNSLSQQTSPCAQKRVESSPKSWFEEMLR